MAIKFFIPNGKISTLTNLDIPAKHASNLSHTWGNDRYWESFKKSYSDLILENQKNDGSWATAKHFHGDSDIFRTALMILMPQILLFTKING